MLTVFNQVFTQYPPTLLYWKLILTCASKAEQPPHSSPDFLNWAFSHISSCRAAWGASTSTTFGGSSMSLSTRDTCTSQGNSYLTPTWLLPPERKHRQLMLSAPQLQPDLQQTALWHTSNPHTVNRVHWHFQDLIQGLTVVSPPHQRLFALQLQWENRRGCLSLM